MKLALVICTPEVKTPTVALLRGDLMSSLNLARDLGYDGVELMIRNPAEMGFSAGEVKRLLQDRGLELAAVTSGQVAGEDGLTFLAVEESIGQQAVERMRKLIDFAGHFGVPVNVGRIRGNIRPTHAEEDRARLVAILQSLCYYAGKQGVTIVLEPINRYESNFINNTHEGVALCKEVDRPNVGLQLDLFHMNIEDVSFAESFWVAGNYLRHIHVADSNRWPPGKGHLDIPAIIATIKELGYRGYLSAEALPMPDPLEAARQTINYLRPLVQ